jgi:hypothetical protein
VSKMFKLKEWLTVEDAAKHLTTVLGEEISVADIYRLALDKHLTLSMNFPNSTYGKFGRVVAYSEAKYVPFIPPGISEEAENIIPISIMLGDQIDEDRVIEWDKEVHAIKGIWDLAMIASECLDVEHVYQQLTGGPEITLVCLGGVLLKRNDVYCCLVERMNLDKSNTISQTLKRFADHVISTGKFPADKLNEMLDDFEKDLSAHPKKLDNLCCYDNYYPAGGLPDDGVYVVKTSAIIEFLNRINEIPRHEKPLTTRERNSLLTLIAAICKETGFNIEQKGTSAALMRCTENLGRPLSGDTIRGILKQAQKILP